MAWLGVAFMTMLFVFPVLIRAFIRLALFVLVIATCMSAIHHDLASALILASATAIIGAFSGFGFWYQHRV